MADVATRIRTAAAQNATLVSYLGNGGSPPFFRWYAIQLYQGTAFPAVTMQLVAGSPTYVSTGRLPTGFSRFQITIWDTDLARAKAVENAMIDFFDQLDLVGQPGNPLYSNLVVMQREGMQAQPEPIKYWRILDVRVFANDTLS